MTIQTFGDYTQKFHPHIHALVSDGLFAKNQTFYVMLKHLSTGLQQGVDLKPLEEIFRAKVFKMLKKEGRIKDVLIDKLLKWRHSGFSVHNGVRVTRDDEEGREALSQYISFITESAIIYQILKHLDLPACASPHADRWNEKPSRVQPNRKSLPKNNDMVYEPFKPVLNLIQ